MRTLMFIVPVDEHEINLITSELTSKASSGLLSSDVLMSTMNYFLTPLVHIIMSSISPPSSVLRGDRDKPVVRPHCPVDDDDR